MKKRTNISKYGLIVILALLLTGCGGDNPSNSEQETDLEPEFDFSGELIAFRSDRDGSDDIWLMKPDGSELINITNNPAADSDPAWSPDGSKIAFVSTRTGNAELFVMNVDGTNVTQVTNNQGSIRWPRWSQDGSMIAFSANVNDQRDLYAIPAPAANQKQIANKTAACDEPVQITDNPETDNEPVWSPDGSSIYFFSTRDGFGGIWEIDFGCEGGSDPVKLTIEFEFACAPGMGFSLADGQAKLSFVGEENEQYDIWVLDLGGSNPSKVTNDHGLKMRSRGLSTSLNPIKVTDDPEVDWVSTWTDDGDRLIYETERNGSWDIYSISEDGTDSTPLIEHPADDRYPAWRPQS